MTGVDGLKGTLGLSVCFLSLYMQPATSSMKSRVSFKVLANASQITAKRSIQNRRQRQRRSAYSRPGTLDHGTLTVPQPPESAQSAEMLFLYSQRRRQPNNARSAAPPCPRRSRPICPEHCTFSDSWSIQSPSRITSPFDLRLPRKPRQMHPGAPPPSAAEKIKVRSIGSSSSSSFRRAAQPARLSRARALTSRFPNSAQSLSNTAHFPRETK